MIASDLHCATMFREPSELPLGIPGGNQPLVGSRSRDFGKGC